MFCLNAIGSKIVDLVEAGYDEGRITEQVSAAYSADIERVRRDVHDFLEALNKQEILQHRPPATRSAAGAANDNTDAT